MTITTTDPTTAVTPAGWHPARWVMGDTAMYPWAQCRFCGRAASVDCKAVTCGLCGTVQCHGNGSGNGRCRCCHVGYLPEWSRSADANTCSRKGCKSGAPAVGVAAKRPVCLACAAVAVVRDGGQSRTLAEYAAERVAERNAGTGHHLMRWRFVGALRPVQAV